MASKVRPALMSNSDLRGMDVLEDLDAFLEEIEEEGEEQDVEDMLVVGGKGADYEREASPFLSQISSLQQNVDFGQSCAACRSAPCAAMAAVKTGHTACLQEILAAQPDLNLRTVTSENRSTLAHVAARRGDLDALRAILEADRHLSAMGDDKGATPLHVCAYHGHVECLRCLLGEGEGGVARDMDGATPVHFAAASGHTECLRVLLEEGGGDPNEQTDSGETPGQKRVQWSPSLPLK